MFSSCACQSQKLFAASVDKQSGLGQVWHPSTSKHTLLGRAAYAVKHIILKGSPVHNWLTYFVISPQPRSACQFSDLQFQDDSCKMKPNASKHSSKTSSVPVLVLTLMSFNKQPTLNHPKALRILEAKALVMYIWPADASRSNTGAAIGWGKHATSCCYCNTVC